ncbi:MAG: hypothetical protein OEM38_00060 [Gammaproteobacteria bacterium]|nr:hypothetical protein [Gammaproteobacteria bacterium]
MRKLGSNIWVVERDFSFSGTDFGNRMTILRLPSGKLVLHSPVEYSDDLANEVNDIGKVAFIITPNNFHGLFSKKWCSVYPKAKYYTAKVSGAGESNVLSALRSVDLESSVEIVKIEGISKLNEFAFIHLESSTLILTDLAFNFDSNVSLWSKVFFKLNGCYERFGPSRLMKSLIDSPEKLSCSIKTISGYAFNKIVVSHGNVVDVKAKEKFSAAFSQSEIGFPDKKVKLKFSFSRCG